MRRSVAAALLVLAAGCGNTSPAAPAPSPTPTRTFTPIPVTDTATPSWRPTPQPEHFQISIRILKKQCFGSAGCVITYQIDPVYIGPPLDDDDAVMVTYEVRGGDELQINSFTLAGSRATFDDKEVIQTPSSSSKLRAVVTDVF